MSLADELEAVIRRVVREELAKAQSAPADDGERLLTIGAAAERAGVSERTVSRWIFEGLPTREVPGRVAGKPASRVLAADLDAWVRALPSRRKGSPKTTSLGAAIAKRQATRKAKPRGRKAS